MAFVSPRILILSRRLVAHSPIILILSRRLVNAPGESESGVVRSQESGVTTQLPRTRDTRADEARMILMKHLGRGYRNPVTARSIAATSPFPVTGLRRYAAAPAAAKRSSTSGASSAE